MALINPFAPTSNFWKQFTIFLHIMLKYNLSKILLKNYSFHFIKWEIEIYLWKQMLCTCVLKNKNIFQKTFKWFLIIMKVESILNHVISHNLNHD